MRIYELLRLEIFQNSQLLTGEIGLENEIESVMILEALDIEKWSRKNQLILTSLYAFENLELPAIEAFFQKVRGIGVSGLVVKVDRLINRVPDWLLSFCGKYQLPLIKIKKDVTYEQIVLAIYQPILNHQSHVLKTYYEVRQRFNRLTRNFSSYEQIMTEFYRMIQKDCLLLLPEQKLTLNFGTLPHELVVTKRVQMPIGEFSKNHYELLTLFSHSESKEYLALQTNIANNFSSECTLLVHEGENGLKETDLMIIENLIDVIQERLQMDFLIKKDRYTRLNNLADAILQNTPNNLDELASLLKEAKIDYYPYYQGVAFATKNLSDEEKRNLRNKLRNLRTHTLFFEHHNYSLILYNLKDANRCLTKEEIHQQIKDFFRQNNNLVIATSSLKPKEMIKEILIDCLDTLRFNQQYLIANIVDVHDLGIFRYFIAEENLAAVANLIPPSLVTLQLHQPELFNTLFAFFQNNRNYKQTSETMYLHAKTIRYRIDRIQDLLSLDLNNNLQTMNIEIATYLLHLKLRRKQNEKTNSLNKRQ